MAYSKARRLAEIVSDSNGNISVEGIIVPTQSNSDNDTSAASTAFVHAHVNALVDSAPGTLNTLNELAAALNDEANFGSTITTAVNARLPLAGGTLTGNLRGTSFSVGGADSGEALNIIDGGHTGQGAANTVSLASFAENVSGNSAGPWLGSMTNENTAVIGTRTASGNLAFQTYDGSAWGERMRITSAGKVGIGINPTHKLQVLSTDNKGFYLERNTGNEPASLNEFSSYYSLSIKNRAGGSFLNFGGNAALSSIQATDGAGTAAAKDIVLNPYGGHVGIGTTPTAWSSGYKSLQIGNRGFVGAHAGSDLYLGQNAYYNSGWKYEAAVAASLTQHSGGQITHFVAAAGSANAAISWITALHIKNNGNVGIGTNNPNLKLHVQEDTDTWVGEFKNVRAAGGYGLRIDNSGAGNANDTRYALGVYTPGGTGFFIRNNGKVGIGTTAPLAQLQINPPAVDTPILSILRQDHATIPLFKFFQDSSVSQGTGHAHMNSGNRDLSITTDTNSTKTNGIYIKTTGEVGIGTAAPPSPLSIFGLGTSSPIAANAQQSYDNALLRINNFGNSSVGLSIGSTGSNWTHLQTSYNEGTTSPLALNPFGGGVYIGTNTALFSGANLQIHGSTDAGGSTQHVAVKNTTTASFSSTAFVGTGRVLDFFTNSNNDQDFSAIRFTNPGGSRETAIAVVEDGATTRDGTRQGDVVIQGYDGDGYIETQRFRANGASSSTGQRRTGSYTSFAYINHTYTFDHNGYSGAGTPSNSNPHWLEIPLYSTYSSSAGGGWVEIDLCWHATHAQAGHLHTWKLVWGSNHTRILNIAVVSNTATATAGSYGPYQFTSTSGLYRHPTAGDAYMGKMYIRMKGSTNHSGARSITLRGVGHPSVKNIAPVIDHNGDNTPDGISPTLLHSQTATG